MTNISLHYIGVSGSFSAVGIIITILVIIIIILSLVICQRNKRQRRHISTAELAFTNPQFNKDGTLARAQPNDYENHHEIIVTKTHSTSSEEETNIQQ